MQNNIRKYLLIISILAALGLAGTAWRGVQAQQAQPTPSDDQVNSVARTMYCPVCENTPLDVCPTLACAQWRDLIRQKLAQGFTTRQIQDYFALQYGDRVLAVPPAHGLNWLIYVLPPLVLLAGCFLLYRVFKGMRSTKKSAAVVQSGKTKPTTPANDPYISKLEEELKRRQ